MKQIEHNTSFSKCGDSPIEGYPHIFFLQGVSFIVGTNLQYRLAAHHIVGQGRGGGCVEGSEHGEKNGTGRGLCEAVKEEVGSITAIKRHKEVGSPKKGRFNED